MRYLAVDIGASSGRHIVGEMKDGKLTLTEVYRFPNAPVIGADGAVWDVDALFEHVVRGLEAAEEKGLRPDCVGIDTWAVDYALVDGKGERVGPVYCYRNARGAKAAEKLHEIIPFSELYRRTGIQYQPFNTLYQLYSDKLSGRLEKAERMLMLPDYINFRLTGARLQEYTNATSTGAVNATTHDWDDEILAAAGLPKGIFGDIVASGRTVGTFSADIKARLGYDARVVLPATHDTASAVIAAPLGVVASPYLSSGTWSLLGIERDRASTDEASMRCNYSNEGSINGAFRFQKNIMGLWIIQQVRHELGDAYSFAELADMARACPHDKKIDVNDPRFLAPESMLGELRSAAGEMSVGETAYLVFSGLADCYASAMRELEGLTGKSYDTLNIIGGGCNNRLLSELTAKATGKKIITGPSEGTAAGNILMQAMGTGELASLAEARKLIRASFEISEVKI